MMCIYKEHTFLGEILIFYQYCFTFGRKGGEDIMRKRLFMGIFLLSILSLSAFGLMVEISLEKLVQDSTDIVTGKVTNKSCKWNEAKTQIVTDVTVTISQAIKGAARDSIVIEFPGGAITNPDGTGIGMGRSDTPKFEPNEEVFVFLAKDAKTGLFKLTGEFQGKFSVITDKATGKKLVESGAKILVSPDTLKAREVKAFQAPVEDLVAKIKQIMEKQSQK